MFVNCLVRNRKECYNKEIGESPKIWKFNDENKILHHPYSAFVNPFWHRLASRHGIKRSRIGSGYVTITAVMELKLTSPMSSGVVKSYNLEDS